MLSEIITVNRGGTDEHGVPIHSLILPDVRFFTLFLNKSDNAMLLFSYEQAGYLFEKIKTRDDENAVEEMFTFDVPDMWKVVKVFPREEDKILMSFWVIYDALVRHFLPWAEVKTYSDKDQNMLGKRYSGLGWFSPVSMEVLDLD